MKQNNDFVALRDRLAWAIWTVKRLSCKNCERLSAPLEVNDVSELERLRGIEERLQRFARGLCDKQSGNHEPNYHASHSHIGLLEEVLGRPAWSEQPSRKGKHD